MAPPRTLQSERVGMMNVARDMVALFFHKDHQNPDAPFKQDERKLSVQEQKLYEAAVQFLVKQFNVGYRMEEGSDDDGAEPTGKDPVREPVKP